MSTMLQQFLCVCAYGSICDFFVDLLVVEIKAFFRSLILITQYVLLSHAGNLSVSVICTSDCCQIKGHVKT